MGKLDKKVLFTVLWRWNNHMLWQNIWSIRKRLPHPRKYRLPIEENIEEPFTRNDYRKQAIYRNGFHKSTQYDRRMALKTFGCVIGNGWCFISWNSKGITNKVPPSWSPSAEKLEKKSLFSASCWNKTTICYDRAKLFEKAPSLGYDCSISPI